MIENVLLHNDLLTVLDNGFLVQPFLMDLLKKAFDDIS